MPTKSAEEKLLQSSVPYKASDSCCFCRARIYVVERCAAEGLFFHRECLRCDYCGHGLRLNGYSFQRNGDGIGKFYCQQHQGMKPQGKTRPGQIVPVQRRMSSGREGTHRSDSLNYITSSQHHDTAGAHDAFYKPRQLLSKSSLSKDVGSYEQTKFVSEHDMSRDALARFKHNASSLTLLSTTVGDSFSSGSESELQFSRNDDISSDDEPDLLWAHLVLHSAPGHASAIRNVNKHFSLDASDDGDCEADMELGRRCHVIGAHSPLSHHRFTDTEKQLDGSCASASQNCITDIDPHSSTARGAPTTVPLPRRQNPVDINMLDTKKFFSKPFRSSEDVRGSARTVIQTVGIVQGKAKEKTTNVKISAAHARTNRGQQNANSETNVMANSVDGSSVTRDSTSVTTSVQTATIVYPMLHQALTVVSLDSSSSSGEEDSKSEQPSNHHLSNNNTAANRHEHIAGQRFLSNDDIRAVRDVQNCENKQSIQHEHKSVQDCNYNIRTLEDSRPELKRPALRGYSCDEAIVTCKESDRDNTHSVNVDQINDVVDVSLMTPNAPILQPVVCDDTYSALDLTRASTAEGSRLFVTRNDKRMEHDCEHMFASEMPDGTDDEQVVHVPDVSASFSPHAAEYMETKKRPNIMEKLLPVVRQDIAPRASVDSFSDYDEMDNNEAESVFDDGAKLKSSTPQPSKSSGSELPKHVISKESLSSKVKPACGLSYSKSLRLPTAEEKRKFDVNLNYLPNSPTASAVFGESLPSYRSDVDTIVTNQPYPQCAGESSDKVYMNHEPALTRPVLRSASFTLSSGSSRFSDAKRRFFDEAAQPVHIDPRSLFPDTFASSSATSICPSSTLSSTRTELTWEPLAENSERYQPPPSLAVVVLSQSPGVSRRRLLSSASGQSARPTDSPSSQKKPVRKSVMSSSSVIAPQSLQNSEASQAQSPRAGVSLGKQRVGNASVKLKPKALSFSASDLRPEIDASKAQAEPDQRITGPVKKVKKIDDVTKRRMNSASSALQSTLVTSSAESQSESMVRPRRKAVMQAAVEMCAGSHTAGTPKVQERPKAKQVKNSVFSSVQSETNPDLESISSPVPKAFDGEHVRNRLSQRTSESMRVHKERHQSQLRRFDSCSQNGASQYDPVSREAFGSKTRIADTPTRAKKTARSRTRTEEPLQTIAQTESLQEASAPNTPKQRTVKVSRGFSNKHTEERRPSIGENTLPSSVIAVASLPAVVSPRRKKKDAQHVNHLEQDETAIQSCVVLKSSPRRIAAKRSPLATSSKTIVASNPESYPVITADREYAVRASSAVRQCRAKLSSSVDKGISRI